MPQTVETAKIASRNVRAAVVPLTGSTLAVEEGDPHDDGEGGSEMQDAVNCGGAHGAILS